MPYILASIGLYGVTAYNAGLRVNEIGLLVGLPLSVGAARFLGNQLYGMSPYNPAVTLVAVVTLGLSALAASLIPAFRASLISPLEALRSE